MSGLVHVLTTVATGEQARDLARAAVEARVAACVQIVGPVTSVYSWEGRVQEESELLCLLKAPSGRTGELMTFVREHHPYDTPEIAVIEADAVDPRYLAWVETVTGPSREQES